MIAGSFGRLQKLTYKYYLYYYLLLCIIWLNPRSAKVKRMLHSDWLPEWARWAHLARPGFPAFVPQMKYLFLAI